MGQPSASQVQQMQVPAETPQGQQSNAIPQPAGEVQAIARETSPRPAERAGRAGGDQIPSQAKNAPEIEAQGESGQSASPPGETTGEREWWDVPVENPENLSLPQVERRIRKLKKARKQDIADEVERMKRTPGGQGVTISYEHEHYNPVTGRGEGQIVGRGAVSNNPQWYQDAWKRYGRKPRKSEYEDIAEESLKKIQEFDERDEEISRLERLRKHLKEQAAQEGSHGGGGKSAQNTAKAANEGGGQEKKSPTSNQDSKEAVGGGEDAVTIEENISKGKEALQKVIDTHDDVKDAMYRDDIGSIDFVWGTPGTGPKFKHGYGLAHIIAKRNAENGDGISVSLKLVDVIGRGTNVEKQSAAHGSGEYRIKIHYDGYTAVLSSASSGRNAWLLTGWEDGNGKNPSQKTKATVSARGEGYDSSTATAATPTLTRRNGETIASVDSSIPQQKTKRNEKIGSFSIGKDGKKFTATLEERLGGEFAKDHAEALATLAGSYGGREKDGKYTFPTKKGRDGFLEVANAYLGLMREKGALKASTAEDRRVRGIVRAMRIVPDAALGKIHSMLSGIGEMMGCPIVWVDANSQLNGIHYRNVTFLNRKAGMDLKKTFWHEQFHWIKANNTALYEELLSCFKGRKAFTKEQLDKYRRDSGRSSLTDAAAIEEILADEFMSVFKRVPMLQEMPGKSRHWRKGSSLGSSG